LFENIPLGVWWIKSPQETVELITVVLDYELIKVYQQRTL